MEQYLLLPRGPESTAEVLFAQEQGPTSFPVLLSSPTGTCPPESHIRLIQAVCAQKIMGLPLSHPPQDQDIKYRHCFVTFPSWLQAFQLPQGDRSSHEG